MTNLIVKCRQATGSGDTALLLLRIGFWMPKATIKFGGERWIAKSAAQWCAETGMSPQQYKDAIAKLRELRLVLTEQHIDCASSRNITHLRLTEHGRQVVEPCNHLHEVKPIPGQAGGKP